MRRSYVIAGVGALGALSAGGARVLWESARSPAQVQPTDDLQAEENLSRCRLYSGVEEEHDPDWRRAELACNRVLDLQPIQEEANRLLDRIRAEQAAVDLLDRAGALQGLDELTALGLLGQIPESSRYYRRAKARASELKTRALPRLEEDCGRSLRAGSRAALPTCEKYLALACQEVSWRKRNLEAKQSRAVPIASDRLFRLYLRARRRGAESAEGWTCPEMKLLQQTEDTQPDRQVSAAILQGAIDRAIGEALVRYWDGNLPTAISELEACVHAEDPVGSTARQLRNRISLVKQLLKAGHTALQADDPESAATPFRAALEHDRQILGGLALPPSSVDRIVRREMGSHAYVRGRYWADRRDLGRACRIWSIGHSFSQTDLSLLQAVKHCSERGPPQ